MAIPKQVYQDRLSRGVCPWCETPREGPAKLCKACAKLHSERTQRSRAKRKERGICQSCPTEITCGTLCASCKARVTKFTKKLYATRKASSQCVWCSSPKGATRFCTECWFKNMSLRLFRTQEHGASLKALFDSQLGRCFYSGERLTPGKNAGLDHQVPIHRGGSASVANLRWVTIRINRIKNDLTHNEFVALCHGISQRFPNTESKDQ